MGTAFIHSHESSPYMEYTNGVYAVELITNHKRALATKTIIENFRTQHCALRRYRNYSGL